MEPLNPFLERSRDRLNDFLENLTRVDNLSEHLMVRNRGGGRGEGVREVQVLTTIQLDKYLALGKTTDTLINISLNEMYFVHSLLQVHLDVLV